jgi:3-methyladenine DNA glycosylase/8-oxoguanine DNA glycosylase
VSTATTGRTAAERRIRLVGPGGEPVDLRRTLNSHGFVDLPPMRPDATYDAVSVTVPMRSGRPRQIRIEPGPRRMARVRVLGSRVGERALDEVETTARHLLRLDEDLSPFYDVAAEDPELAWVTGGAGRMVRSATVFEDVVKTICTTNCAWSATVRMVHALVRHLGEPASGAPAGSVEGRAFPTPHAMASAGEPFYRDVVRAGYRGAYLAQLAGDVASGELDLEPFGHASADDLPDDELEGALLALPGVGPYAAAHIMMTLGRYHRLILDSWTRPTYAKKVGRKTVGDATIVRRFRRYGPYAGLAFWLFLTEDWVA